MLALGEFKVCDEKLCVVVVLDLEFPPVGPVP